MKNFLTTACLFIVTVLATVSFIAPEVLGQDVRTAKVEPLFGKTVVTSQADGWRTIQFETTQVTAPDVAVTPVGEWLIFTMLGKLFRLSVKGGEAEQLTFGPYYDNDPAISPDGKLVAFQSDRDGSEGNIFILTLATKEIRQLTRETWADKPTWARDGQTIVYLQLERTAWKAWSFGYAPVLPPGLVRRVRLTGGEPETLRPLGDVASLFHLTDGRVGWAILERDSTSLRWTTRIEVRDASGNVSTLRLIDGVADPVVAGPKADGLYARTGDEIYAKSVSHQMHILFEPLPEGTERRIVSVSGGNAGFAVASDNRTLYLGNLGHLWKISLPGGRREAVPFRAKVTLEIRQSTAPSKWTPVDPGTKASLRTIRQPELAPDGSRFVFQALGDLWEQPTNGGQARRLVEGEGTESDAVFSSDGRELAFIRRAPGKGQEIQVLEFQSWKIRTVAPMNECGWEDLTWSPNGELISSTDCAVYEIIAIDPVKLTQRVLAKTTNWTPYAQLSADGKTLYFQAGYPGSDPSLYRLRLEPEAKPEILAPAPPGGLRMKMHGQWMARPIPNGTGIHLSPLSGGSGAAANTRIFTEPDGHEFSFTPDGSGLLYVAGNKLWRQPLKGGEPQEIPIRLEPRVPTPPPTLLKRVRVLNFATGGFGAETSLLLENGRIRWVGPTKGRKLPTGTVTIDAAGRFAIPGLFDMHSHLGWCGQTGYVAYGVTSVRDMGGRLEIGNYNADWGDFTNRASARCFSSGRILEGAKGRNDDWGFVHPSNADDARTYVRRWKAQGAQFIKLYERLAWPIQTAAAAEAHRVGLPVVAHGITLEQVVKGVTLGYAGFAHWERLYDDTHQLFAAAGTRWEPALGSSNGVEMSFRVEPERFRQATPIGVLRLLGDNALSGDYTERLRTMRAAFRRGVTFLPGTDSGTFGLALQWELEFYAEAGIPPLDILRFATKEAAKAVGAQDHLGTLEAGKLADLILLDANPLDDIKNTQKIWRVFKGGWMFDPKVLQPNRN